jgi:hypothetical protein
MHALMPFAEALADMAAKVQGAGDRDSLRAQFDHGSGVLRGYYFAGAICEVEVTAALAQLRGIYRKRFDELSPDTWPARVLNDKRSFQPHVSRTSSLMEHKP